MNRNTKHPGRSYRRKTSAGDTTKNTKAWRITASWDARPDRPAVKVTSDRKAMRRTVREWSEQGAYVIVEEHAGYGAYRTLYEVDGPALVAERLAAEQAAAEAAERERLLAEQRAQQAAAEQRRRHRLAAEVTAHARALMTAPAIVRPEHRQRARHVTGAQR